jgi:hypothetical protein
MSGKEELRQRMITIPQIFFTAARRENSCVSQNIENCLSSRRYWTLLCASHLSPAFVRHLDEPGISISDILTRVAPNDPSTTAQIKACRSVA